MMATDAVVAIEFEKKTAVEMVCKNGKEGEYLPVLAAPDSSCYGGWGIGVGVGASELCL